LPITAYELTNVTQTNVSVNYIIAFKKFYSLLFKVAFAVKPVNKNIYIGIYKLIFIIKYTFEGPIIIYKFYETVIDNIKGNEYKKIYIFVIYFIIIPFFFPCFIKTVVDYESDIFNKIIFSFKNNQKFDFL